jgi:hypothetical protein
VSTREKAQTPEDLTRLFVQRANAGDAEGVSLLYEEDAVMAYPPGSITVGRAAPLPTLVSDELALTSTPPHDGAGARAQVVRRQSDGTWLRVLDQPEFISTS